MDAGSGVVFGNPISPSGRDIHLKPASTRSTIHIPVSSVMLTNGGLVLHGVLLQVPTREWSMSMSQEGVGGRLHAVRC